MDNGTANWRESEGKKARLISLYHIWRLRVETRRLATETGRRMGPMGVVRRFIYNQTTRSATHQRGDRSVANNVRSPPFHRAIQTHITYHHIIVNQWYHPSTMTKLLNSHILRPAVSRNSWSYLALRLGIHD